jgi:hypothetical protein
MKNNQKPSAMPIHRYKPFHEQITVIFPTALGQPSESPKPQDGVLLIFAMATRR